MKLTPRLLKLKSKGVPCLQEKEEEGGNSRKTGGGGDDAMPNGTAHRGQLQSGGAAESTVGRAEEEKKKRRSIFSRFKKKKSRGSSESLGGSGNDGNLNHKNKGVVRSKAASGTTLSTGGSNRGGSSGGGSGGAEKMPHKADGTSKGNGHDATAKSSDSDNELKGELPRPESFVTAANESSHDLAEEPAAAPGPATAAAASAEPETDANADAPGEMEAVEVEISKKVKTEAGAGATEKVPQVVSETPPSNDDADDDPLPPRPPNEPLERHVTSGAAAAAQASGFRGKMQRRKTTPPAFLSANLDSSSLLVSDGPEAAKSYDLIPLLETTKLPRGGITIDTAAVGRVQFGIPPETIKDSMRLGLAVPCVYIVPVERFCREMGPALGVNLAEFEFPAYFNFFVQRRRCTLIVDSLDAERNIRKVFSETLLGPRQFRLQENPIAYQEEDFDPSFPREAIPNFAKELRHFRIMPNGSELELETLLEFAYFETPTAIECQTSLGVPPPLEFQDMFEERSGLERANSLRFGPAVGPKEKIDHRPASVKEADKDGGDGKKDHASRKHWTYSQVKCVGDVATLHAPGATPEQKIARTCKRVEIFKLPGGTEYVLHDIDENNHIVGKARFSGSVKVPEFLSVAGFTDKGHPNEEQAEREIHQCDETCDPAGETCPKFTKSILPPTFHPPSFGVTVLGNSHGFDKSGSTSGYVLWINGRGVMIDPPPYSSATLEREGIRPRTIVGIILTHCHADHDAGAFQKVLTGSPVVVITTPTIYESFIRKYAALSALSPALLRHSHRHKSAIIGQPLRFQGATFHFTYTLHSIPCVGFRVEWRGRSMVFTGDHMNIPEQIDKLQEKSVLSQARADDLHSLPLQDTDLLLHESGAPPIHTPLDVLLKLPQRVKRRLYVVHTSALPEGCELRVAPTGTAGTIRLDQLTLPNTTDKPTGEDNGASRSASLYSPRARAARRYSSINEDAQILDFPEDMMTEYGTPKFSSMNFGRRGSQDSQSSDGKYKRMTSVIQGHGLAQEPPLVALRPTSSTDAWFILNLLSAVPFLSSLSYSSTMEVLETARVDAYCVNEVVVPASRRRDVLCVVWEGTCMEREQSTSRLTFLPKEKMAAQRANKRRGRHASLTTRDGVRKRFGSVWHAGDWTGPRSLQPEKKLSGESSLGKTHDIVAMSSEGVKVITIEFSNLHSILTSGSSLYRKYLARKKQQAAADSNVAGDDESGVSQMQRDAIRNLNIIELLDCNSSLRKLSAVQKRHLESLAEGPVFYAPGQRLWRSGAPVDRAFIVVAGTVAFVPKRRNAGSVGMAMDKTKGGRSIKTHQLPFNNDSINLGEAMQLDALKAMKELGEMSFGQDDDSSISSGTSEQNVPLKEVTGKDGSKERSQSAGDEALGVGRPPKESTSSGKSDAQAQEFEKLEIRLKSRADSLDGSRPRRDSSSSADSYHQDGIDMHSDSSHSELATRSEGGKRIEVVVDPSLHQRSKQFRRSSSKDRLANKVLGRLYSRRAFTAGLVFSRGHFLGDVSKMVAGLLSSDYDGDDSSFKYGFGDSDEGAGNGTNNGVGELTIHEREGDQLVVHSSTLAAGKDGCSVIVFPKANLIPFLDDYPGLLLSLLGTQVVV